MNQYSINRFLKKPVGFFLFWTFVLVGLETIGYCAMDIYYKLRFFDDSVMIGSIEGKMNEIFALVVVGTMFAIIYETYRVYQERRLVIVEGNEKPSRIRR